MDCSIWFNLIILGWFTVLIKGMQAKFPNQGVFQSMKIALSWLVPFDAVQLPQQFSAMLGHFLGRLNVHLKETTFILIVGFESHDLLVMSWTYSSLLTVLQCIILPKLSEEKHSCDILNWICH